MAATHAARITRLEARFDSLDSKLDRLIALHESADAPAKVARPKAEPKARKAAKPQVRTPKAPAKTVTLTRKTRSAFVAKAPWAQGLSTQAIAAMCVEDPSLVPAGFAVGEGYKAMFA